MPLKIAYITSYDANDINNWSGTGYYISKTVEKYLGSLTYIGILEAKEFISHKIKKLKYKVFGEIYDPIRTELIGRFYAQEIEKQIKGKHFDLIFSPGTIPIAYLETNIPVIFWSDSNFHGMINYYITNYSPETIKDGNLMEKTALEKSTLAIYSSEWAANNAIDYYMINSNKVKVIPFGANISNVPVKNELKQKLNEEIRLLFVGRDWERKGGKIVYDTMKYLNERGIKTCLTVVGCVPPQSFIDEKMKVIPFLDKSDEEDAKILRKLYLTSDFFILPSRKECYGIVFCEAAAFGLPVLSSFTGGISTIVKEAVNGYLLPIEAEGKAYSNKIIEIIKGGKYGELCISSRKRYDGVLNWDVAGQELNRVVTEIV